MSDKTVVTLTGHKHSGKDYVAERLAMNSAVKYIKPYTDKGNRHLRENEIPEEYGGYHFVTKEELDLMIQTEKVISITTIEHKGELHRYVFFESQLTAPYNVLIVDDYALVDFRSNWKGKLFTIRVKSKNQIESDRVGEYFYEHEFDEVFNYGIDDFDELEAKISDIFR